MAEPLVGVLVTAVLLALLYLVVRAAVHHGVRDALRPDLLRPERPAPGPDRVQDGRDRRARL